MTRPRPTPPRPELVRRPGRAFGWLDARLLHDGWLSRLGPEGAAVLAFLALAADAQGASFYGRGRMCSVLGIGRDALDQALARLLALGLVAHRPWRTGDPDGVWQLLPLPTPAKRGGDATSVSDLIAGLGLNRRDPREP